jgi:hypothetical protein
MARSKRRSTRRGQDTGRGKDDSNSPSSPNRGESVTSGTRDAWIAERIHALTNRKPTGPIVVFDDTSNFMSIERDSLIELEGDLYLVRCNEREGRFGLDDQPKFWVKRALSLETGRTYILKLVYHEDFKVRIGALEIRCTRSEEKEGRVLELVRGDSRFMQGRTTLDSRGNLVRVIDFIPGVDLMSYLHSIEAPHEKYFEKIFPLILSKIMDSFRAIQRLHEAGLCHGDIRNDHILLERETGTLRWIDFDLTQDFPDFDTWSLGNILHCVVGKGFVTFRSVLKDRPDLGSRLTEDDASAFYPHRIMNLAKVYPYVPEKLSRVLRRFTVGASVNYETVEQFLDELEDYAASME